MQTQHFFAGGTQEARLLCMGGPESPDREAPRTPEAGGATPEVPNRDTAAETQAARAMLEERMGVVGRVLNAASAALQQQYRPVLDSVQRQMQESQAQLTATRDAMQQGIATLTNVMINIAGGLRPARPAEPAAPVEVAPPPTPEAPVAPAAPAVLTDKTIAAAPAAPVLTPQQMMDQTALNQMQDSHQNAVLREFATAIKTLTPAEQTAVTAQVQSQLNALRQGTSPDSGQQLELALREIQKYSETDPSGAWKVIPSGIVDGMGEVCIYRRGTVNNQPALIAYSPHLGIQTLALGTTTWNMNVPQDQIGGPQQNLTEQYKQVVGSLTPAQRTAAQQNGTLESSVLRGENLTAETIRQGVQGLPASANQIADRLLRRQRQAPAPAPANQSKSVLLQPTDQTRTFPEIYNERLQRPGAPAQTPGSPSAPSADSAQPETSPTAPQGPSASVEQTPLSPLQQSVKKFNETPNDYGAKLEETEDSVVLRVKIAVNGPIGTEMGASLLEKCLRTGMSQPTQQLKLGAVELHMPKRLLESRYIDRLQDALQERRPVPLDAYETTTLNAFEDHLRRSGVNAQTDAGLSTVGRTQRLYTQLLDPSAATALGLQFEMPYVGTPTTDGTPQAESGGGVYTKTGQLLVPNFGAIFRVNPMAGLRALADAILDPANQEKLPPDTKEKTIQFARGLGRMIGNVGTLHGEPQLGTPEEQKKRTLDRLTKLAVQTKVEWAKLRLEQRIQATRQGNRGQTFSLADRAREMLMPLELRPSFNAGLIDVADAQANAAANNALGRLMRDFPQNAKPSEQIAFIDSVLASSQDTNYAQTSAQLAAMTAGLQQIEDGLQTVDTACGTVAGLVPFGGTVYNSLSSVTGYAAGRRNTDGTAMTIGQVGGTLGTEALLAPLSAIPYAGLAGRSMRVLPYGTRGVWSVLRSAPRLTMATLQKNIAQLYVRMGMRGLLMLMTKSGLTKAGKEAAKVVAGKAKEELVAVYGEVRTALASNTPPTAILGTLVTRYGSPEIANAMMSGVATLMQTAVAGPAGQELGAYIRGETPTVQPQARDRIIATTGTPPQSQVEQVVGSLFNEQTAPQLAGPVEGTEADGVDLLEEENPTANT